VGDWRRVPEERWPVTGRSSRRPGASGGGRQFAQDLAEGTITHLQSIDARIEAQAQHWRLERMAVIDRLILRMAVYEFLYRRIRRGRS